ncbi:hypothetical protein [Sphingobacterium faecium]|uniref:hypothetical protein n=1 Tax=Sphingobacterium faecium TaxID=34087 RepID=UPI0032079EAE
MSLWIAKFNSSCSAPYSCISPSFLNQKFSISNLFSISKGEQIIREGFARWPDVIAEELELLKRRLVD